MCRVRKEKSLDIDAVQALQEAHAHLQGDYERTT